MEIVKIKMKDLLPTEENPNVMSENKFNALVRAIEELGYDQPIKVWFNPERQKYEIVKGNHRYWALKILGLKDEDEVECVLGNYKNRDEMLKDMVRDNVVRGEIDPVKFTQLYDKISAKYGKDVTREMFSFIEEAELKRLYKEIKKELPEELKKKLEEAKEEIKTIDDLSIVLNKIFSQYGDTLKWNFMIFDYLKGGKCIYIRASKENWKKIEEIADYCTKNQKDINEVIKIEMRQDI
jgi:ParB-like chromosome segregation protein Spo0J